MTIFYTSPVAVDPTAVVGTFYDANDLSWIIHPNAIIDIDEANGRFMWGGVRYASIAAIVAATHGSTAGGISRLYMPGGSLPAAHTLYGKGLAPATGGTRFLAALDDGNDGAASDELEFIGFDTANLAAAAVYRASALTVNCTGAAGGNVAQGGAVKMAMKVTGAAGTSGLSINGAAVRLSTSGTGLAAQATQLVLGNREDGTRPWAGTRQRIALISGALSDADLVALTTL